MLFWGLGLALARGGGYRNVLFQVGSMAIFDSWGVRHPVTVLQLDECEVVQVGGWVGGWEVRPPGAGVILFSFLRYDN